MLAEAPAFEFFGSGLSGSISGAILTLVLVEAVTFFFSPTFLGSG